MGSKFIVIKWLRIFLVLETNYRTTLTYYLFLMKQYNIILLNFKFLEKKNEIGQRKLIQVCCCCCCCCFGIGNDDDDDDLFLLLTCLSFGC